MLTSFVIAQALFLSASAVAQSADDNAIAANNGWSAEQKRDAAWYLDQHKKLSAVIAALAPQRPGVIDAYVVSIGLDSDPVFGREASEAAKVLARRYGAAGRSITLATGVKSLVPQGSPANLATALAAVAAKMDVKEDVLILYATSHGTAEVGLVYRDGEEGYGLVSPKRLAKMLDGLGINRRMLLISACFSGVFVPALKNDTSIIVTAASGARTSFGCAATNDWTYFGDALINTALRKSQSFDKAVSEALILINGWESERELDSSEPQVFVGDKAAVWLGVIEKRVPTVATAKVGRPAIAGDAVEAGR
ncbi:MAG: C13 family peptidase [Pseudomonadota bacterium]